MKFTNTIILATLVANAVVNVSIGDEFTTQLANAQATFEQSLAGDKKATTLALNQFQQLAEQSHRHPLITAYLGSAHALKARDAWMPWTRLKHVEKGLDIIDSALLMLAPIHDETKIHGVPISVSTRLVAVSTFLSVPDFLNRLQHAKDVLQVTLSDEAFAGSPPATKARLLLQAARAANREDAREKEISFLRQVLAETPTGAYADEARAKLARISHHEP